MPSQLNRWQIRSWVIGGILSLAALLVIVILLANENRSSEPRSNPVSALPAAVDQLSSQAQTMTVQTASDPLLARQTLDSRRTSFVLLLLWIVLIAAVVWLAVLQVWIYGQMSRFNAALEDFKDIRDKLGYLISTLRVTRPLKPAHRSGLKSSGSDGAGVDPRNSAGESVSPTSPETIDFMGDDSATGGLVRPNEAAPARQPHVDMPGTRETLTRRSKRRVPKEAYSDPKAFLKLYMAAFKGSDRDKFVERFVLDGYDIANIEDRSHNATISPNLERRSDPKKAHFWAVRCSTEPNYLDLLPGFQLNVWMPDLVAGGGKGADKFFRGIYERHDGDSFNLIRPAKLIQKADSAIYKLGEIVLDTRKQGNLGV